MEKPKHHIFVCASFRATGEPQGVCRKKGSVNFLPYLEEALADREMSDITISLTGCLKVCDRGPSMIIYPENYWYGKIESEAAIDEVLDALSAGKSAENYLIV